MRSISAALLGLVLVICAACGPEDALLGGGRVTAAGANELLPVQTETVSELELLAMIDPNNRMVTTVYPSGVVPEKEAAAVDLELHRVLASFSGGAPKVAMIQDRLVFASDQKCNLFLKYLSRIQSYNKTTSKFLSIISGGVGTLVTSADLARVFSGVSGMSAGLGAAIEDNFFSNVATSVIGPAIIRARLEYYNLMLAKRKDASGAYGLGEAITDAVRYNGLCTLDTGIAEAARAVQVTAQKEVAAKTGKTSSEAGATAGTGAKAPVSLSTTIRQQSLTPNS